MCGKCANRPSLRVFKALEVLYDESNKGVEALAAFHTIREGMLSQGMVTEVTSRDPLLLRHINAQGQYVYQERIVELES